MKTTNINDKYQSVTPDEGMMLTNGESISEGLFTAIGADLSAWREITKEEAEALQAEIDARNEQLKEEHNGNESNAD